MTEKCTAHGPIDSCCYYNCWREYCKLCECATDCGYRSARARDFSCQRENENRSLECFFFHSSNMNYALTSFSEKWFIWRKKNVLLTRTLSHYICIVKSYGWITVERVENCFNFSPYVHYARFSFLAIYSISENLVKLNFILTDTCSHCECSLCERLSIFVPLWWTEFHFSMRQIKWRKYKIKKKIYQPMKNQLKSNSESNKNKFNFSLSL